MSLVSNLVRNCGVIALVLCFAGSGDAFASDVTASKTDITFHITHPAKEYDVRLLAGGANIVGRFDPMDLGKTSFDVKINVDKFNSDNSRRDSHMIEVLEGLVFPSITWKVAGLDGVTGPIKPGQYKAYASGPLTLHGVSKTLDAPVVLDIAENGNVTVSSSFSISLEEYSIERPTLVFVPIEDNLPIKVSVVFPGGAGLFPPEPTPASVPEEAPTAAPESPLPE